MTQQILEDVLPNWGMLTPEELETLASLLRSGKPVFAAPIEIESTEQMEALGLRREQCRTWQIGNIRVTVHLTPADEETCLFLLRELQRRYRHLTRQNRCLIPGRQKPLIRCPDGNRCSQCPFPQHRDGFSGAFLSLDSMIADGFSFAQEDVCCLRLEQHEALRAAFEAVRAANPKYLRAFLLREYAGLSVGEIAGRMHDTERNVYYYISQAKRLARRALL